MHIVFVGDKPSSKNTDPEIAFIGTQSHKRLLSWISYLNLACPITLINRSQNDFTTKIRAHYADNATIIALGANAANSLKQLNIKYYCLPHPSGRNRLLNNSAYVLFLLDDLKAKLWR